QGARAGVTPRVAALVAAPLVLAAPMVCGLSACGADAPHARSAPARAASSPSGDAGARGALTDPSVTTARDAATLAPLDAIASAALEIAPGMAERMRVDDVLTLAPIERTIAHETEHDVCARAAFVAVAPVNAALVDGAGA